MIPSAAPQHPDSQPFPTPMPNAPSLVLRAFAATRAMLALIGFAAVAGYLLMPQSVRPESWLAGLPGLAATPLNDSPAPASGQIQVGAVESPLELEQRTVTDYIAKRYRVSDQAVAGYVSLAYQAGAQHSVDPLLILAVMAIESRYNPVAESSMGARGLMQVIPKYHLEKLIDHGGEPALLEPAVNIVVGAQILREYQRRFRDTETALQMYAGALDDVSTQYASKVLAEKARLDALKVKARKQTGQSV